MAPYTRPEVSAPRLLFRPSAVGSLQTSHAKHVIGNDGTVATTNSNGSNTPRSSTTATNLVRVQFPCPQPNPLVSARALLRFLPGAGIDSIILATTDPRMYSVRFRRNSFGPSHETARRYTGIFVNGPPDQRLAGMAAEMYETPRQEELGND